MADAVQDLLCPAHRSRKGQVGDAPAVADVGGVEMADLDEQDDGEGDERPADEQGSDR